MYSGNSSNQFDLKLSGAGAAVGVPMWDFIRMVYDPDREQKTGLHNPLS